jgi:hypothetical protein
MPHYFFHLKFGDRISPDEEGAELRDRAAAREEALGIVRDLSHPATRKNLRRWAGWFLQVADAAGDFLRVPIGYPALELVPKSSSLPAAEQPRVRKTAALRELPSSRPAENNTTQLVAQILERRRRTLELVNHNQQLRDELSTLHLQSQEIRNRTRFVVSAAREARGDSPLARSS